MFIILVVILTLVSLALKISASGFELASIIASRKSKNQEKGSNEVAKIGLATSTAILKLSSFIVSRVRDLVAFVGSFVVVLDVIILIIVIVTSASYLTLLPSQDVSTEVISDTSTSESGD